jgi:hypothetical protein
MHMRGVCVLQTFARVVGVSVVAVGLLSWPLLQRRLRWRMIWRVLEANVMPKQCRECSNAPPPSMPGSPQGPTPPLDPTGSPRGPIPTSSQCYSCEKPLTWLALGVRAANLVANRRRELMSQLCEAPNRVMLATVDTILGHPHLFPLGAVVIKDETGKSPRERSVSLAILRPSALLLNGDSRQLPPIVHREMILSNVPGTLLDDVKANRPQIHRLYTQYRMAPSISALVSALFYDNQLRCGRLGPSVGSITWVHTVRTLHI